MLALFIIALGLFPLTTALPCPKNLTATPFPQFQIIAAAKTGSTSLFSYLCQHPNIHCIARKKETNLLRSSNLKVSSEQDRMKTLKWYRRKGFSVSDENTFSGLAFEASIHYYHYEAALNNLHALLPCSRIIWMLRNPLPRALSEYLHQAVKAKNYPSFISILRDEITAIEYCTQKINGNIRIDLGFKNPLFACLAKSKLKKYTLSTGFYAYFITAWLQKFSLEQNLFLDYDLFKSRPAETMKKIVQFLGIQEAPKLLPLWKYNKANTRDGIAVKIRRKSVKLPKDLRMDISRICEPHVKKLYEIIKEDFHWTLDEIS